MKKGGWIAASLALFFLMSAADVSLLPGCGGEGGELPGDSAVVINELLPAPGTVYHEEWIELYNTGGSRADLGGWSLDDIPAGGSRPFMIPNGTAIEPGGFLLFHSSATHLVLNNDGDRVRLLDREDALMDEFLYNSSDRDVSWGRVPDGSPAWREFSRPTPGAPNPAPQPADMAGRQLLLTQVYYHAYAKMADEFVAVSNPTGAAVDLSGWRIADNDSSAVLPDGTRLGPGLTLFVTGKASDFLPDMGFLPDIETSGSRSGVARANTTGHWPSLPDERGWVALEDQTGQAIDLFAWGDPCEDTAGGWAGLPAGALESGEVARRAPGPAGGWTDTNSSADWPASRKTVVGRTDMPWQTFDAEWVKTFVSPDCSFDVIAAELDGARTSVSMAVYQLESLALAERLALASRRGVAVRVLLEGYPVGGITDQERAAARLLADAGAQVEFMDRNTSTGAGDRYTFMHAKYCIVDGLDCLVVSENWKSSGIPADPTFGNRGWGVAARSRGLAAYLGAAFEKDFDPVFRDIISFSNASRMFGPPPDYFLPDASVPAGSYEPRFRASMHQGGLRVSPVLSPDTSSLPERSVLAMIDSAARTLYIEQLSVDMDWKAGQDTLPDYYLDAAVAAARRGVEVKVLLDGTYLDPSESSQDNSAVLNYLRYTAFREGLDLEARIARIPGTLKLHNKGVVVDGDKVLVSTINWGGTSVLENREVGIIIEGPGPAAYFQEVFLNDWELSAGNVPHPPEPGPDVRCDMNRAFVLFLPVLMVAAAAVCIVLEAGARRRRGDRLPLGRRRGWTTGQ